MMHAWKSKRRLFELCAFDCLKQSKIYGDLYVLNCSASWLSRKGRKMKILHLQKHETETRKQPTENGIKMVTTEESQSTADTTDEQVGRIDLDSFGGNDLNGASNASQLTKLLFFLLLFDGKRFFSLSHFDNNQDLGCAVAKCIVERHCQFQSTTAASATDCTYCIQTHDCHFPINPALKSVLLISFKRIGRRRVSGARYNKASNHCNHHNCEYFDAFVCFSVRKFPFQCKHFISTLYTIFQDDDGLDDDSIIMIDDSD